MYIVPTLQKLQKRAKITRELIRFQTYLFILKILLLYNLFLHCLKIILILQKKIDYII